MRESVVLEIDLDAIRHNIREITSTVGEKTRIAAVIKANAYGLGATAIGRAALEAGASILAVARLEEALELERTLPGAPILVMGHTADQLLPIAVEYGIRTSIFDLDQARILSDAGKKLGKNAIAHIKVDTGMNRLGMKVDDYTPEVLARMAKLPRVDMEGIFTHLALVGAEEDKAQFDLFTRVLSAAEARGMHFKLRHICDSIGLVRYPDFRLDLVRVGALMYGMKALTAEKKEPPVVHFPATLKARVARVARIRAGEGVGYDFAFRAPPGGATIGTLTVGYADGYPRRLSGKAEVLVRGARAPVVGLICMDQMTVDLSGIPDARAGDEAILLGDGIHIGEIAKLAGTNRNEILSAVGRRVKRVYSSGGRVVESMDYLGGGRW